MAAVLLFLIGMAGRFLYAEWAGVRELRLAEEALRSYHYEQAQHHLERSLIYRPRHYNTHLLLARVCRQLGDLERAEMYLDRATNLQEDPSEELRLEGLMLRAASGEIEEVRGQLVRYSVKETREAPLVLEALGNEFLSKQDPGNARWCAERWRLLEPENPRAYLLEGKIHFQAGNYRAAKGPLEKGLERDPENTEIRSYLAQVRRFLERLELASRYREQRAYEKASRVLRELLAEEPDNAATLHERGLLERDQGKYENAVETFRQVLTLDLLRPLAHRELAECLRRLGKLTEADEHAARYKELEPVSHRLEVLALERARSPANPAVHHQIGELLYRQGKVAAAMKNIRIALDLDPHFAPAHRLLADFYMKSGKPDQAYAQMRQARP